MDIWSKEKRSYVMSRIRSTDTRPEKKVRSLLHQMGYRFRLHLKNLPGRPDIVLPKYKTVIFVHGCFWHLHFECRDGTIPKTEHAQWKTKLENNVQRDIKHYHDLRNLGWCVVVVWECEVEKHIDVVKERIQKALGGAAA